MVLFLCLYVAKYHYYCFWVLFSFQELIQSLGLNTSYNDMQMLLPQGPDLQAP